MGLRVRKSFKVAPGVRINVGSKSASVSMGVKGAHKTFSTSGRTTTSVHVAPGISSVTSSTSGKSSTGSVGSHDEEMSPKSKRAIYMTFIILLSILTLFMLIAVATSPIFLVFVLLFGFLTYQCINRWKNLKN